MTEWLRTRKDRRCPVCGKPDWCSVAADGTAAHCMRIASDRPLTSGGWIHRLAETAAPPTPRPRRRERRKRLNVKTMFLPWWRGTPRGAISALAAALGVSAASLSRMPCAWAPEYEAWAFPMFDGERRPIGIRLRSDIRKWAVTGSRNGLFWPLGGLMGPAAGPLLVCEGPTDTAALLDLGFDAIGRPSCNGGAEYVRLACRKLHRRDVVIVADADEPGIDGADALARMLVCDSRSVRVIQPVHPHKDVRAWVRAGATHAAVECIIAQQPYRKKETP